jgi:hypothetical protein
MDYRRHRDRDKLDAINRIAQFEDDAGFYDKVLHPDEQLLNSKSFWTRVFL